MMFDSQEKHKSKRRKLNLNCLERGRYHVIVKETVATEDGERKLPKLYLIVPDGADGVRPEPVDLLLDYFSDHSSMSYSWKKNTARALGALVDFSMAMYSSPDFQRWKDRGILERRLYRGFAAALRNGSEQLGSNGRVVDPARLYWRPLGQSQASVLLSSLTLYFRWLGEDSSNAKWVSAANTDAIAKHPAEALRMASELQMRQEASLLGHLKGLRKDPSHPYPFIVRRPTPKIGSVPTFPAKYVGPFLREGFVHEDGHIDETAQAIAYLIFGLGLRKSESFHLFVSDIQFIKDIPWVFFHHPEFGKVADGSRGLITRREYLKQFTLLPRNLDAGRNEVGWKGMGDDGQGTPGFWLPVDPIRSRASLLLQRYLFKTRPAIMAARPRSLRDHPLLFVNPRRIEGSDTGEVGDPYTLSAFDGAWERAVRRVGERFDDPDMRKMQKRNGNTPHGARHFYGRFLFTAGVEGPVIQRCMHHKSLDSHRAYTRLTSHEINDVLQDASVNNPDRQAFRDLREDFMSNFDSPVPPVDQ